jgi:excisionase family DNA binding protein
MGASNTAVKPGPKSEPLCSVKDVARFLSVSKSWVYRAAERGVIPAYRVGNTVRFKLSEIAEWLRWQRND